MHASLPSVQRIRLIVVNLANWVVYNDVFAGVVCTTDYVDHNAEAFYALADQALYKAKKHGRDLVMKA